MKFPFFAVSCPGARVQRFDTQSACRSWITNHSHESRVSVASTGGTFCVSGGVCGVACGSAALLELSFAACRVSRVLLLVVAVVVCVPRVRWMACSRRHVYFMCQCPVPQRVSSGWSKSASVIGDVSWVGPFSGPGRCSSSLVGVEALPSGPDIVLRPRVSSCRDTTGKLPHLGVLIEAGLHSGI